MPPPQMNPAPGSVRLIVITLFRTARLPASDDAAAAAGRSVAVDHVFVSDIVPPETRIAMRFARLKPPLAIAPPTRR